MPRSFAIGYTVLIVAIVPFFAAKYGISNFLWFSNIALLLTTLVLWFPLRLLASMQLVSVGVLEVIWTLDITLGLVLLGDSLIGLTAYMFDENINLYARLLSLYHVPLPLLLLWLVWQLGYDDRAWWAQTLLAWPVLLVCYFFTEPWLNINWVFGLGPQPQHVLPSWLYLLLLMLAFPLLVYLPTHALATWLVRRLPPPRNRAAAEVA